MDENVVLIATLFMHIVVLVHRIYTVNGSWD